jgi:hypothetical protein
VPSDRRGGRGRSGIVTWRVLAGKREVFSDPLMSACERWIREHGGFAEVPADGGGRTKRAKLRLVRPNV